MRDSDANSLTVFMENPLPAITEAITGWLSKGPSSWVGASARIVQGVLKGRFFPQVAKEIEDFRKAGNIDEDFADRKYGYQSFVDLLTAIDEGVDEDKLDALKAMFFSVNRVNQADAQRILAYQLFQIAKRLTSGELLVLSAIYRLHRQGNKFPPTTNQAFSQWATLVSAELGHGLNGLVENHERALIDEKLLSDRHAIGSDRSEVGAGSRMTDLGLRFCENIDQYHIARSRIRADKEWRGK